MIRILSGIIIYLIVMTSYAWSGEKLLTPDGFNRYKAIHIRNITEDLDLVVNQGSEDNSSGLAFGVQGEHVFAVWRVKSGSKELFLRASHDGGRTLSEPVLLDRNETEALTRIEIGSNAKGDVHVLWYGEKQAPGARYHIYTAHSNDFGKTFSKPAKLTAGYAFTIYPNLLVDEEGAYTFPTASRNNKKFMLFRSTADRGKTWGDITEVKEIETYGFETQLVKTGGRLHVFWYNDSSLVIEHAYSDDKGNNWTAASLEDTRGVKLVHFKVTSDPAGRVYIVFAGRWGGSSEKHKSYLIISGDRGETWEKPRNIRHYPFEHTQTTFTDIEVDGSGEVVVVWHDYRNIRRNLYMNYSLDYGRTWQESDIPLEEPGRFNTAFYAYTDSMVRVKDRYYLLAHRFRNDIFRQEADLLLLDFKIR
jgi:hypothetical protein